MFLFLGNEWLSFELEEEDREQIRSTHNRESGRGPGKRLPITP
jgi:hypothetical protein